MTQPRKPVSFIATRDPQAAIAFYGDVLGLTLIEHSPYALVFDDNGHPLRIQIVTQLVPASHTVLGWQVTDIDDQIASLSAKGVAFLIFDQLPQDASGIWTTPDGARIAWFNDPSGNILSLTQHATP